MLVLTAADLPVPRLDEWVIPNVFPQNDPCCYERMFSRRNVIIDDRMYGTKNGFDVDCDNVRTYKLGPGCFGEFVIAPGFTTYAGQTIALVTHPDETTSRKLAFKLQQVFENFFKEGDTWQKNVLCPDPLLVNMTPSLAVRNISESKSSALQMVTPPVHARGPVSMYDEEGEQGKNEYEAKWSEWKKDTNITYVESERPVVANRQAHMYMETQTAIVRREEDRFYVSASTQSVSDMASRLSEMLHVAPRDVVVSNQRIGGGFGGKELQSINTAALAAFACIVTGHPSRIALDRQVDFDMIGKRHGFEGTYRAAVNKSTRRIVAMELTYDADGGCSSDVTPAVMTRACIIGHSFYDIPEFRCTANSW